MAWSSGLFVFRCGLEFQAICISLLLGVPSYLLLFAVAWSSELSSSICISMSLGVPSYLYFAVTWSSELFVFRCGLEFRAQQ